MLPGREAVPFRAKFCLPVGSRHLRLTLLHSNDIHGRQDRIGQIATLVRREKATADHQVIYLDAGDVEDTSNRLSSMTKGSAMHRLLSHAGCDAATVGNGGWQRYGPQILAEHARAATYPLLLANFDELARRLEAAAERCETAAAARVRARHHQRTAPNHLAWFDRPPAVRFQKGGRL